MPQNNKRTVVMRVVGKPRRRVVTKKAKKNKTARKSVRLVQAPKPKRMSMNVFSNPIRAFGAPSMAPHHLVELRYTVDVTANYNKADLSISAFISPSMFAGFSAFAGLYQMKVLKALSIEYAAISALAHDGQVVLHVDRDVRTPTMPAGMSFAQMMVMPRPEVAFTQVFSSRPRFWIKKMDAEDRLPSDTAVDQMNENRKVGYFLTTTGYQDEVPDPIVPIRVGVFVIRALFDFYQMVPALAIPDHDVETVRPDMGAEEQ